MYNVFESNKKILKEKRERLFSSFSLSAALPLYPTD
jgi:hypothetical protein